MKRKCIFSILVLTAIFTFKSFAWQPQQFGDKKELSLVIDYTISKQTAKVKDSEGNSYILHCTSEPLYDGKILSGVFVFSNTMKYAFDTLPVLMRESEYKNLTSEAKPDDSGDVETPAPEEKIDMNAMFPGMAKNITEGRPNAHLEGRSVDGAIPRPTCKVQESGKVIVTIWVDNYGNVKEAEAGADGTTVQDKTLWEVARKAALQTHFTMSADAPALQQGSITYCFNLSGTDIEDKSFKLVDQKPTFNGGDATEFSKWVMQHLCYPKAAKKKGIQGRVMLSFKVNEDGSVSDVKVLRGVEESLDKEAVRVVSSSPKWEPGKSQGRPAPVTYTFPVIFQTR